jgi:hypothetical protein
MWSFPNKRPVDLNGRSLHSVILQFFSYSSMAYKFILACCSKDSQLFQLIKSFLVGTIFLKWELAPLHFDLALRKSSNTSYLFVRRPSTSLSSNFKLIRLINLCNLTIIKTVHFSFVRKRFNSMQTFGLFVCRRKRTISPRRSPTSPAGV